MARIKGKGKVKLNRERVALRRHELALTQEGLAEEATCCGRTVSRAESGGRVALKTARKIAQALRVELPTILSLEATSDDSHAREGIEQGVVAPGVDDGTCEDRVVAAFKAADETIRQTLGGDGEYGTDELTEVLSLLATRYGCARLKAVQVTVE